MRPAPVFLIDIISLLWLACNGQFTILQKMWFSLQQTVEDLTDFLLQNHLIPRCIFQKPHRLGRVFLCPKLRKEHEMEQEKLCVIKEKSYEAHIDEKVHAVPVILSHW